MIIGHGIDIIEVARVNDLLNRYPQRFQERIFTEAERDYCWSQSRSSESFAARLAGKEAVYKIMSPQLKVLRWREINIAGKKTDKPYLELYQNTALTAERLGISDWHISLSHEKKYAIASVIAEGG